MLVHRKEQAVEKLTFTSICVHDGLNYCFLKY